MTPRHPRRIVLLILLILVILSVGGFFLWQYLQPKAIAPSKSTESTTQKETTPNPAPQPEPIDPYIGWNTYTSQRDGYELKHPPEWIVIKESSNDGPYIRNMQFTGGSYPEGYINLRVLRDVGTVLGSDLTPKDWYTKLGVTTVKKGPVTFTPDVVGSYEVNSLEAKKAKSIFTEIDEDIFILRGDILYEINMYPYGISENPDVKNILNSFKFI